MQSSSNESLFLVELFENILSPKHWWRTLPNFIRQGRHGSK